MKRVQLISFAALVSGLFLSLTMVDSPNRSASPGNKSAASSHQRQNRAQPSQTKPMPMGYPLRLLQAATKSLAYFPTVKQAIAIPYPEQVAAEATLAKSEVTLFGVGPVRIGMTLQEAADALDLFLIPVGSNVSGECTYYQPETKTQAMGFMVVDNRVIRIDIWAGSTLATVSGASIGSSETEVLATYPEQIEVAPNPYTQGKVLTLVPNDPELSLYRLVFETDAEGKVVQYRTGQFPAVTWPDGCV